MKVMEQWPNQSAGFEVIWVDLGPKQILGPEKTSLQKRRMKF